jgi:hypothetical protein
MKRCNRCDVYKDNNSFPTRGSVCKLCKSEYNKKYRLENKEKLKNYIDEYSLLYRLENKEKLNEKSKKYNIENKEIVLPSTLFILLNDSVNFLIL